MPGQFGSAIRRMQRETPVIFSDRQTDTHANDYKVSACRITFLLELRELRSTESGTGKNKHKQSEDTK